MEEGGPYQSVKEAVRELQAATLSARANQPASVRLPPVWNVVHAKGPQSGHIGASQGASTRRSGFPRTEDFLPSSGRGFTTSCTSSVGDGSGLRVPSRASALGGSNRSGLNHTATYYYGDAPLKPVLCSSNRYNAVGSYSMFGSQASASRPYACHPGGGRRRFPLLGGEGGVLRGLACLPACSTGPSVSPPSPSHRCATSPTSLDLAPTTRSPLPRPSAGGVRSRLVGRLRLRHLDARPADEHLHLSRPPQRVVRQALAAARHVHAPVVARQAGPRLEDDLPGALVWRRGEVRCGPARQARHRDAGAGRVPRLRRRNAVRCYGVQWQSWAPRR